MMSASFFACPGILLRGGVERRESGIGPEERVSFVVYTFLHIQISDEEVGTG